MATVQVSAEESGYKILASLQSTVDLLDLEELAAELGMLRHLRLTRYLQQLAPVLGSTLRCATPLAPREACPSSVPVALYAPRGPWHLAPTTMPFEQVVSATAGVITDSQIPLEDVTERLLRDLTIGLQRAHLTYDAAGSAAVLYFRHSPK